MNIEYRHIFINADNIDQYRNGLVAGKRESNWRYFDNKRINEGKITLYSYSVADNSLNARDAIRVRELIKLINSRKNQTIIHETHHFHNESNGLKMHISKGICYIYLSLYCLDEISARTAEALYDISTNRIERVKTKVMGACGIKPEVRAIFKAIDKFQTTFSYYCEKAIKSYKKETKSFYNNDINIEGQEKLYQYDLNMLKEFLYTKDLYKIVENYFTFNGVCIKDKLNKSDLKKLQGLWEKFESRIFNYAKTCIKNIDRA